MLYGHFSCDLDAFDNVNNQTRYAEINRESGKASVQSCGSLDCALMINLFGSLGEPGPVLKITARGRKGSEKSFTECIRKALAAAYGTDDKIITLGGVFVIKTGRSRYHVMPDFPPRDKLPFPDRQAVSDWLTFHRFQSPMVCLTVFHSADPEKLDLRMEHTHCFSADGRGGHYHYDVLGDDEEDVE